MGFINPMKSLSRDSVALVFGGGIYARSSFAPPEPSQPGGAPINQGHMSSDFELYSFVQLRHCFVDLVPPGRNTRSCCSTATRLAYAVIDVKRLKLF